MAAIALIVEDRPSGKFESLRGHPTVRFASDSKDAITQLQTGEINVLVMDVSMNDGESNDSSPWRDDWLATAKAAESLEYQPQLLMFSSHEMAETGVQPHPISVDELLKAIRQAAGTRRVDNRTLQTLYEDHSSLILPKSEIVRVTWDFQTALENISQNPRELI